MTRGRLRQAAWGATWGAAMATIVALVPLAVDAAPPPARLSATGLYRADGTVDPRNRPFAPQYPLWTDGATKRRWIRLPEGATIDVSDVDAWRFPPGTTLWKEFAWEGRRVETRMIRREMSGEWIFASYVWSDDQRDAELAPPEGVPGAFPLPASTGARAGRRHSIPGTADCLSCHGSAPSPVLGFDALQLSDDRDPDAPHAEPLPAHAVTLSTLVREGRLMPARPELVASPPRIRTADPVERAAIGYLHGNCGACHNPRGPLARLGFSLRHDVAGGAVVGAPEPALLTTRAARGRFVVPGVAADSCAIVTPGVPERSTLPYRMRSRRATSQMPPLGSVVVDSVAVRLVERWVAGMGTGTRVATLPR